MRKIEQRMLRAIAQRKNWESGNTRAQYWLLGPDGPYSEIFLHGNHIATYHYGAVHPVEVNERTLARWPSPTTKSRLRALGVNVSTRKGVTYLDGKPL